MSSIVVFFVTAYHRSEQYEPPDRIEDEWKHIENVSLLIPVFPFSRKVGNFGIFA